jgi:hypothetical protein
MSIPSNYLYWILLIILDKDKTMVTFTTNLFPRIWLLSVLQVNIFSAPSCYCSKSLVSDHVGRSTAQSGTFEERCTRFPQSDVKQLHGHAMSELRKLSTLFLKVTDKFSRSTQQCCLCILILKSWDGKREDQKMGTERNKQWRSLFYFTDNK